MLTVTLAILAITARAAVGKLRAFKVSGAGDGWDNLYLEEEGSTHFKKIGPPDTDGDHDLLWRDDETWNLGFGKTFSTWNEVKFSVEGGQNDAPPTSGWVKNTGWLSGEPSSKDHMRVVQLPSLVYTRRQTVAEGGSWTVDGGAVCNPGEKRAWVYLTTDRICDKSVDCHNQMDEKVCFEENMNQTQTMIQTQMMNQIQTMNQTQTIILNGVGLALSGVYSLEHWDGIQFYSSAGKLGFIYQPSGEQGLVIGSGENVWSATAVYRREGQTVWKSVGDGSLAGSKHGITAPGVRLTPIPNSVNKSLLENNANFEKEITIPGVGIICIGLKDQEKTLITFNDQSGEKCDGLITCQHGGDEKDCQEASLDNATEMLLINGVKPEISGLYQRTASGIGLYDRVEGNGFVYTGQQSGGKRLILGQGEGNTSASARALYKSTEETRDITEAVWEDVTDGTRNGRSEGSRASRVQVIPVPDVFSERIMLENRANYEKEESLPGFGIICLTPRMDSEELEQTYITFNDTDAGWCDKTWHCQFGGTLTYCNLSQYSYTIVPATC